MQAVCKRGSNFELPRTHGNQLKERGSGCSPTSVPKNVVERVQSARPGLLWDGIRVVCSCSKFAMQYKGVLTTSRFKGAMLSGPEIHEFSPVGSSSESGNFLPGTYGFS